MRHRKQCTPRQQSSAPLAAKVNLSESHIDDDSDKDEKEEFEAQCKDMEQNINEGVKQVLCDCTD